MQLDLRRLTIWTSHQPNLTPTSDPDLVLLRFLHDTLRSLRNHPLPARAVARPSTVVTWARRLEAALPDLARSTRRQPVLGYLQGVQAAAPALSPNVQRGVEEGWAAAIATAFRAATARSATPIHAATWLTLTLQRLGMRPLAALRGSLPQAERLLRTVTLPTAGRASDARTTRSPTRQTNRGTRLWQIKVLLDKHNRRGAVAAPVSRWILASPSIDAVMARLPVGYEDVAAVARMRAQLLAEQGVRQTYAARRDAAAQADARGLSPHEVLNHRPGSRSTPGYVGATTPVSVMQALMQAVPTD